MRTCLYAHHLALGAKITNFSGWEMPLQYQGITAEHRAVRDYVGVFDVSHMGRIEVTGKEAGDYLNFLSTNQVAERPEKTATYTVWCTDQGTCLEDLIVYKVEQKKYFVIANAANREKDLAHMHQHAASFSVTITPQFHQEGILALQGPQAEKILKKEIPSLLPMEPMRLQKIDTLYIASTGYTGSGGFEIFGPHSSIEKLFQTFTQKGVTPVGLGARDTLRLEAGFALYGHELTEEIMPHETVSSWTIKWKKETFLGKEALEKKRDQGRRQQGVRLDGKRIARQGDSLYKQGKKIGIVTSGSYSPTLECPIAIAMVEEPLAHGEKIEILIKERPYPGKIVPLPFWKRSFV